MDECSCCSKAKWYICGRRLAKEELERKETDNLTRAHRARAVEKKKKRKTSQTDEIIQKLEKKMGKCGERAHGLDRVWDILKLPVS